MSQIHRLIFLSYWSLILTVFHKWSSQYFNPTFLTLFVLVGSTYVFYVKPGHIPIIKPKSQKRIDHYSQTQKSLAHIVLHILPFVWMLHVYGFHGDKHNIERIEFLSKLVLTGGLLAVYGASVDVKEIYGLNLDDIMIIVIIACVIFFTGVWLTSRSTLKKYIKSN